MSSQVSQKRWVVPFVIVAILGLVLLLSTRTDRTSDGKLMVRTPGEYSKLREDTQAAAIPIVERLDKGEPLTEADREVLERVAEQLDAMMLYEPTAVVPAFLRGRIAFAFEDSERAEVALRQAIANSTKSISEKDSPALKATAIEAHYLLSRVLASKREFEEAYRFADIAVKGNSKNPNYLAARASAAVQLKKMDVARLDVIAALRLDPNHSFARGLAGLLLGDKLPTEADSSSPPTGEGTAPESP
jgi:tetratricopeptide (TPR) repeat protein